MGKPIEVAASTIVGDVLLLDTDRSITGQDGVGYESAEAAAADEAFPGRLAARIFGVLDRVSHVFIASNQVVVGRSGGWDDNAAATASEIVSGFFVFYTDA